MPPVPQRTDPPVDDGEPTLRTAAFFALGMGVLHAGAALAEECLRKFNLLLALVNLLFAGWLFGWLRCRDDQRRRDLEQELDEASRELDALKLESTGNRPGETS
ncbi:MAG TPA: hypothetical protein VHQ65_11275 [Thermoanaerobaculia bacterium]|nr:hypothetical protein [Thermoanaerobaculia bacterium]